PSRRLCLASRPAGARRRVPRAVGATGSRLTAAGGRLDARGRGARVPHSSRGPAPQREDRLPGAVSDAGDREGMNGSLCPASSAHRTAALCEHPFLHPTPPTLPRHIARFSSPSFLVWGVFFPPIG